jgi:hypothetical protein
MTNQKTNNNNNEKQETMITDNENIQNASVFSRYVLQHKTKAGKSDFFTYFFLFIYFFFAPQSIEVQ